MIPRLVIFSNSYSAEDILFSRMLIDLPGLSIAPVPSIDHHEKTTRF
jgi:hypothetical protein